MEERYFPQQIEPQWQKVWQEREIFRAREDTGRQKLYVLEMFPYPSGNLHMGHVRVYVIGDVLARYWRMRGREVFHPMGWDALGLPAENAALRDGIHPAVRTRRNIDSVRRQMKMLGLSIDWSREVATCDPEYYRWNQWFFIQMYKKGLVYRRESLANWCTGCRTVLANEQVVDGKCERCQSPVVLRRIPDWALRITTYADQLLEGLDKLDWPERVLTMQRNWIGRSEGARLVFHCPGGGLEVFTTRADTVYGATYMVLAPEHPRVAALTSDGQRQAVQQFVERVSRTSQEERLGPQAEKEGVWTGSYAVNPFTGEKIPVWIANFVLAGYGTGAVMSVPAHDQRDFEFAKKYGLPIRVVIQPLQGERLQADRLQKAFEEDGMLVDSGPHSGKSSAQARRDIAEEARARSQGGPAVSYHLRDWGISRQRYWGTPIPMIYCERCGVVPVPEEQLPVVLPGQAPITGTGEAPLAKVPEFVNTTCPACGGPARRDTDTMDTFVDSSWYFARYLDPHQQKAPFRRELAHYWLPVDIYVGGPEHAVMHLLYFRFWTRVMRDLGLVGIDEPARKLITQGMVLKRSFWCEQHHYRAPDGVKDPEGASPACSECGRPLRVQMEKMSKSKLNGVAPETMCQQYGADTARLFVLFAAPPEKDIEWSDTGVAGCFGFLRRLWAWFHKHSPLFEKLRALLPPVDEQKLSPPLVELHRQVHRTIERVTRDIEKECQFNTAIAAMMELLNACRVLEQPQGEEELKLLAMLLRAQVLLLSPFAPHAAEQLWQELVGDGLACTQSWPEFDPLLTQADLVGVAVQVNGKLRDTIMVSRQAGREALEQAARNSSKVQKWLEGKEIKRVVVVPGRLVNFVVAG
jgi:leucyl-tRNA synthetase